MQSIAENVTNTTLPVSCTRLAKSAGWRARVSAITRPLGITFRIATVCLVLYWIAIFIGTHLPGGVSPRMYLNDKVLHFGAYAGLAFLLSWAIPTRNERLLLNILIAVTLAVTYGCIDEISQKFVPDRNCCFYDLLADMSGAGAGVLVYLICRRILKSNILGRRFIDILSR